MSLEGTLLSVSEHPRAWRKIARLGGGTTYMLSRRDGKSGAFVDRHSLSPAAVARLISTSGLATPVPVYVFSREESDEYGDDQTYEMVFATRRAAEREAEGTDGTVTERSGWKASPELSRRWATAFTGKLGPDLLADFALMEAIEALGEYDGMWWKEDLDPWSLSAPRGGIFQSRLSGWVPVAEGVRGYVEATETWDE